MQFLARLSATQSGTGTDTAAGAREGAAMRGSRPARDHIRAEENSMKSTRLPVQVAVRRSSPPRARRLASPSGMTVPRQRRPFPQTISRITNITHFDNLDAQLRDAHQVQPGRRGPPRHRCVELLTKDGLMCGASGGDCVSLVAT